MVIYNSSVGAGDLEDEGLPNNGVVEALLSAGAPDEPHWLFSHVLESSWKDLRHPAYVAMEKATLDRFAAGHEHRMPLFDRQYLDSDLTWAKTYRSARREDAWMLGHSDPHIDEGERMWLHRAVTSHHWSAVSR